MVRKFHNHKLQTNPCHCEEEPHSNHEALGKQTKPSNQISLPHLLALFLSHSLALSTRSPNYSLPPLSLSLSVPLLYSLCRSPLSILFVSFYSVSLYSVSLYVSLLFLPLYVCLYSLSLYSVSLLSLYTLFSTCTPLYPLYT